jgi:hypothetical protein
MQTYLRAARRQRLLDGGEHSRQIGGDHQML